MLFFPHSPLYGFSLLSQALQAWQRYTFSVALTRVSACALFLQRLHQQVERRL